MSIELSRKHGLQIIWSVSKQSTPLELRKIEGSVGDCGVLPRDLVEIALRNSQLRGPPKIPRMVAYIRIIWGLKGILDKGFGV